MRCPKNFNIAYQACKHIRKCLVAYNKARIFWESYRVPKRIVHSAYFYKVKLRMLH